MQNLEISIEDLPQGPMARYLRDINLISGKIITEEEEKEMSVAYEKARLENPQVYNWKVELNQYVTLSIWRLKDDPKPRAYICDMAPNGGAGTSDLDGLIGYAQMHKRYDLVQSIKDAYEKASLA